MIDYDKWQEIFESINRHRLRSILTAFGVAWGIFMLVMLLAMSQGLQNGIQYQFEGDALNSLWLGGGRTSKAYNGNGPGREITLRNDDLEAIQSLVPEINYISQRNSPLRRSIAKYKDKAQNLSVYGMNEDGAYLESLEITHGRFFNKNDLQEAKKVAVIGQEVHKQLFGDENPVGKMIDYDGILYRVVGVFFDPEGEWVMRRIYLPATTIQHVYSDFLNAGSISLASTQLTSDEMIQAENSIRTMMARRHNFDKTDKEALRIYNSAEEYKRYVRLMFSIKGMMWIVGIFTIISGVIGVSNIMLIIVKERTREIGIRKALGATPRSIVSMVFQESIVITAMAGYLGLGLGIAVLLLLQDVETPYFRSPQINFTIAISATIVLVLAGALAGLLPAIKAARINPVIAMKNE